MDRGNVSFMGDAFKFGPRKALSLLNGKLRNDKTISNFLSNRKYDKMAAVARTLGYGKKKPKRRMKGGSNPFAQLINPKNWEFAASIGKNVFSDVIIPVATGKIPNPFDMGRIVYDGVKKVTGGRRKRAETKPSIRGMRKIRVVGGKRIDTPYNKGLLM